MLVPGQESQELGAILERAECDGSPVFLLFLGDDAAVMPQGFLMLPGVQHRGDPRFQMSRLSDRVRLQTMLQGVAHACRTSEAQQSCSQRPGIAGAKNCRQQEAAGAMCWY